MEKEKMIHAERLFVVYEEILDLENRFGNLIPIHLLEEAIEKRNKTNLKPRISNQGLKQILENLVFIKVLIQPRKDFFQRASTFDSVRAKKIEELCAELRSH